MSGKEINDRIRALCRERSWTVYRLAKKSGITYSTLSTMLNKENIPSIPTLMKICDGFGISLAQFFENDDRAFSQEEIRFLDKWNCLPTEDRSHIERYIDYLLEQK